MVPIPPPGARSSVSRLLRKTDALVWHRLAPLRTIASAHDYWTIGYFVHCVIASASSRQPHDRFVNLFATCLGETPFNADDRKSAFLQHADRGKIVLGHAGNWPFLSVAQRIFARERLPTLGTSPRLNLRVCHCARAVRGLHESRDQQCSRAVHTARREY